MDLALWILAGLALFLGAAPALCLHHAYTLYARFVRDWDRAADRHRSSLKRLAEIDTHGLPFELERFVEMMRCYDRDNAAFCSAQATYWKNQIPKRLRVRYLDAP